MRFVNKRNVSEQYICKNIPRYENNCRGHAYNGIKKKIVGNGGECNRVHDVGTRMYLRMSLA